MTPTYEDTVVRCVTLSLLICLSPAPVFAQTGQELEKRVAELEARVKQLEDENRALRNSISVMPYLQQASGGPRVDIDNNGQKLATLIVSPEGWGKSPVENVAAVAASTIHTLYSAMPPAEPPTIVLVRVTTGSPKALSARGPQGEFIVQVNTGDMLWAQLAYQFAHELGHVACGKPDPAAPQQWLEEAFCEACSIWTLEHMAEVWKTRPPYSNWASYGENLRQYAEDVRAKVDRPQNHGLWYNKHRDHLDKNVADRDLNRVVAEEIFVKAQARPELIKAFLYLRASDPADNTIEARLKAWRDGCPAELKFAPEEMARLLGVKIAK